MEDGPMMAFTSETTARITVAGIELVRMMRKQQDFATSVKSLWLKAQFKALAA